MLFLMGNALDFLNYLIFEAGDKINIGNYFAILKVNIVLYNDL
jgi:hypothetical protein